MRVSDSTFGNAFYVALAEETGLDFTPIEGAGIVFIGNRISLALQR